MAEHDETPRLVEPTIPYYVPAPPPPGYGLGPGEVATPAGYSAPAGYAAAPNPYAAPAGTPGTYGAPTMSYAPPPAHPAPPAYGAAPTGYAAPPNAYPPANTYGAPQYPASPYPAAPYPAAPYPGPGTTSTGGKRKLDLFAAFALGTSIFSLLLFSIPLGIAGIVRTKRDQRRGRGLAVASLVISLVWILVIVALFAFDAGRKPTRSADGSITHQGSFSPTQLRTGDCATLPRIGNGGRFEVRTVTVVPCSSPHNSQVFDVQQASDQTYPGLEVLTQEALHACALQVQGYLGTTETTLELIAFAPSDRLWAIGSRSETCLLQDAAKDITGDIRADK